MTLDQNLNNKKTHKCFNWPIKIWKNVLKIWLQSVGVEQQQQEQSQMFVSWKFKKIFCHSAKWDVRRYVLTHLGK